MNSFIVLYGGPSTATARPIATSSDPDLVRRVVAELLDREFRGDPHDPDAVRLDASWRRTLRRVRDETEGSRG